MPSAGPSITSVRTIPALLKDAAQRDPGGVRRDDLVVMTARTTPPYLPAELAGLIRQTQPRVLITDAGLAGLVDTAGLVDAAGVAARPRLVQRDRRDAGNTDAAAGAG
jgi:hypothetical protein